jgi:hypothetical protein
VERRVTLRRMLAEAVEDQLSLNAALPRTLAGLLRHPGFLSTEYMAGRIQRYVPPFRLYLVSSLIFFLALSFVAHVDEGEFIRLEATGADSAAIMTDSARVLMEQAAVEDTTLRRGLERAAQMEENWLRDVHYRTRFAPLDSAVNRKLREFQSIGPRETMRQVLGELVRRAPTAMFILLPVFALLLKLLYLRRDRYYVEHFVFGLHTHSFSYLVLTVMLLLGGWVEPLLMLWLVGYYYVAMKRFYGQGWFKTLVKYGLLFWTYSIMFGLVLTGTLIVAVLLT